MAIAIYLSHPEVVIDPSVPVPDWSLSDTGRRRAALFGRRLRAARPARIVSSRETKAMEAAAIIGEGLGLPFEMCGEMGENDRSATGFVPSDRFEALADAFFARPDESVMGWETALAAQGRIVGAVQRVLAGHAPARPLLFVGHGAVGTLLWCALSRRPISRVHDQRGAGNAYAFSLASHEVLCEWTAIENWEHSQWPES